MRVHTPRWITTVGRFFTHRFLNLHRAIRRLLTNRFTKRSPLPLRFRLAAADLEARDMPGSLISLGAFFPLDDLIPLGPAVSDGHGLAGWLDDGDSTRRRKAAPPEAEFPIVQARHPADTQPPATAAESADDRRNWLDDLGVISVSGPAPAQPSDAPPPIRGSAGPDEAVPSPMPAGLVGIAPPAVGGNDDLPTAPYEVRPAAGAGQGFGGGGFQSLSGGEAKQITIDAVVRDFKAKPHQATPYHPDFEGTVSGQVAGLVQPTLGPTRRPVFAGDPGEGSITSAATFDQWYRDVAGVNLRTTLPLTFTETAAGSGVYQFTDLTFFPIDGQLYGDSGQDKFGAWHNFHFTLELHNRFTYVPGQFIEFFNSDDDLWVFIDSKLAIDIGGVHPPAQAKFNLDTLGLTPGQTYKFDMYYAERHTVQSTLDVATSIELLPAWSSLAGSAYLDRDGDGTKDAGEEGLYDVPISLTGTTDGGVPVSRSAVTAMDGSYKFDQLPAGTYTVTETQPAGHPDGQDKAGTAGGTVGNDVISAIALAPNTDATGYLFGESVPSGTLAGSVFVDADWDGARGPSEGGLGGVTVTLRDAANVVVGTTTTATDGTYSFPNRPVGDYTVTQTQPTGYTSTTPDVLRLVLPIGGRTGIDFGEMNPTDGWTFGETGGTADKKGSWLVSGGKFSLTEGDSFHVWGERPIVLPANPSTLSIQYSDLTFSPANPSAINDAVEFSLVDLDGRPLVGTFDRPRDAYANFTEGMAAATGPFARPESGAVSLDVSGVAPGTRATLRVRMVNNDVFTEDGVLKDVTSTVTVAGFALSTATAPKFFVADGSAGASFRYGSDGRYLGQAVATGGTDAPRGIAANAVGTRTWVIDEDGTVRVYDATGYDLGSWEATGVVRPEDVATDGTDVWVLDAGQGKVLRYTGAARRLSGTQAADSSFALDPADADPTGLVTDGTKLWVADRAARTVFVYTLAGSLAGSWGYGADLAGVTGVTLDPTGGTGLWLVDRVTAKVYHYPTGRTQLTGTLGHDEATSFALSAGNQLPEGIADPLSGSTLSGSFSGTLGGGSTSSGTISGGINATVTGTFHFVGGGAFTSTSTVHDGGGTVIGGYSSSGTYSLSGTTFSGTFTLSGQINGIDIIGSGTISGTFSAGGSFSGTYSGTIEEVGGSGGTAVWVEAIDADASEPGSDTGTFRFSRDTTTGALTVVYDVYGTAGPGADYTALGGTVVIPDGSDHADVVVVPLDDQTSEEDETVIVDLYASGGSGGSGGDYTIGSPSSAVVTIHDNDTCMDPTASAVDVARAIAVDPAWVTGAAFVHRPTQGAGLAPSAAVGHCPVIDFPVHGPTFGVLSSGDVRNIRKPGYFTAVDLGGATPPGRGNSAFDVTTLRIDLNVPAGAKHAAVDLRFLSEEFPSWVGSAYNDAVILEWDQSTWAASGSTITAPDNFAFDIDGKVISINSTGYAQMAPSHAPGTAFDGGLTPGGLGDTSGAGTVLLRAYTPATPGSHSLFITVFDQGDRILDSAVIVDNLHFGTEPKDKGIEARIHITAAAPDTRFPVGSTVLVSGTVTSTEPVARVTVDDAPVQALDAAGRFFTRVTIGPGDNVFRFEALSESGLTAETSLTLTGFVPDGVRFDSLTDTSAALKGEYGRTSFDVGDGVLYADLAVRNTGTFRVDAPLLVGVRDISHPTVQARAPDGFAPDGTPYWDFSELVGADGVLDPNELTAIRTVAFDNPLGVRFTYDLVPLGQLNRPPSITSLPVVRHHTGSDYSYDAEATDPDGHPLAGFTLAGGPAGMTIDAASGVLSWPQAAVVAGTYVVSVEVRDDRGGLGTQTFTLEVTPPPPNRPPAFTSLPVVTAAVNTPYTYALAATDPDGDAVTFELLTGPAGMAYNPATQQLEWTPTGDQFGVPHTVRVQASDEDDASAVQEFEVQVGPEPGNHAPQFTTRPGGTAVTAGQTFRYDADAVDPDGDSLTYRLTGTLPGDMAIDPATGLVTWTVTTFSQPIAVAVAASDGRGGVTTQPLVLTYVPSATASIAGVVFDDPDGDGLRDPGEAAVAGAGVFLDLNANRRADASEPSVASAADGSYQFPGLAPGNYHVGVVPPAGRVPTRPLTGWRLATVAEGQALTGIDFGTVVPPPAQTNRPPEIHNDDQLEPAPVGQPWRLEILATDPDGDTLTYDAPLAPDGLVVDPATGVVSWTPRADQVGPHELVLRVQDGRGGVAWIAGQVVVTAANTAPVITSSPNRVAYEGAPYRYAVRAQDADPGDTLTYRLVGAVPSGMTIDQNTGVITWPSPAGAPATTAITVEVDDGRGGTDTQPYELEVRVSTPNQAPSVTSRPRLTVAVNQPYFYQVTATDPDGDPLTYSLDPFPDGMEIDPDTGLVTWTAAATPGTYDFTVRVSDGRGGSAVVPYTLTVESVPPVNRAPTIRSSPGLVVRSGRPYAYDVRATDPDSDPVGYILRRAPTNVSFDGTTGSLRWVPRPDQVGAHVFEVVAIDALGAASEPQTFTVTVTANRPPEIDGGPPTLTTAGTTYFWAIDADDPDEDPLTFRLVDGQQHGITIDADGLVTWAVPTGYAGQQVPVIVAVSDGLVELSVSYKITVTGVPVNHAPVILSSAPPRSVAGTEYKYQVVAQDPDPGDVLYYELRGTVPGGMSIGKDSGLVTWNPTAAGTYSFWVAAVDEAGLPGVEQVHLVVRTNTAPQVIEPPAPPPTVVAGRPFDHFVKVTDAENDPVTFAVTGPAGLTIDKYGLVSWEQTAIAPDSYSWSVTVTDAYGAPTTKNYTVEVLADTEAPVVVARVIPPQVANGKDVVIEVSAEDNIDVVRLRLTVNGQELTLENGYRAVYPVQLPAGTTFPFYLPVLAEAWDAAGLRGTSPPMSIEVIDPSVTTRPVAEITSPGGILPPSGAFSVTAPTPIVGTVRNFDGGVVDYKVEVFEETTDGRSRVRLLNTPNVAGTEYTRGTVTAGQLGQFDPTLLENGRYAVVVTARNGGGKTATAEVRLDVTANLKLGNFHLDFTDLSLPVAGIPLTVQRSYDTLWADESGDFGHAWRLSFGDPKVRINYPPGFGSGTDGLPYFRPGTRVVLTLADGSRQGFTFEPIHEVGIGVDRWRVNYRPDRTNTYLLTSAEVDLIDYAHRDGRNGFEAIGLDGLYHSYHPGSYFFGKLFTLTGPDGVEYDIYADPTDREMFGKFYAARDPNGNELLFTPDGVQSNRGPGLRFERDGAGRIERIFDPMGNVIQYRYDGYGDLIAVTDQMGFQTQFEYNTRRVAGQPGVPPHFLETVIDPLGRTVRSVEYHPDGRLKAVIVNGQPIQVDYDLDQSLRTMTDPLGRVTAVASDDEGNVTQFIRYRSDGSKLVDQFSYDTNGNMTSATDPLGNVTGFTYDDLGNRTSMVLPHAPGANPNDFTTEFTYDKFAQVTSITGADGGVQTFRFDAAGNLESETDATGKEIYAATYGTYGLVTSETTANGTSTYKYRDDGQPSQITDPSGAVTLFSHDTNGRITGTTMDGVTIQTGYDKRGRMSSETHPEMGTVTYGFDHGSEWTSLDSPHMGRQERVFDADGRLTEWQTPDGTMKTIYRPDGTVQSRTSPNGTVTEYEYDDLGRQTSYTVVGTGTGSVSELDAAGRVTRVTIDGVTTEFTYYPDGQVKTRTASGKTWSYTYTPSSVTVTDPLTRPVTTVFDANGQVVRVIYPDGTSTGTEYRPRVDAADATDYISALIDESDRRRTFDYDGFGRLTSVADWSGTKHTVSYAADGWQVTGPTGTLAYQLDSDGRTTKMTHQDSGQTKFTYTGDRQSPTTVTLPSQTVITFGYNADEQVTSRTTSTGESAAFTYTPGGNVETATDATGVTQYAYDPQGRLKSITYPSGGRVEYRRDSQSRIDRIEVRASATAAPKVTGYRYDSLGRLDQVTDPLSGVTTFQYDAASRLERRTLPNGVRTEYRYDDRDRVRSITHHRPDSTVLASVTYDRSPSGEPTRVTREDGSYVVFGYDDALRLDSEEHHAPNGTLIETVTYTYDPAGNRTRKTTAGGETTYTYQSGNRLTGTSGPGGAETYGYDVDGNTQTIGRDGATLTVGYDSTGQVTSVSGLAGGSEQYTLDAAGRRVRVTAAGGQRNYLVAPTLADDLESPYLVTDGSGNLLSGYAYVGDAPLMRFDAAGNPVYYLEDDLGSVIGLADQAGGGVADFRYDGFGNLRSAAGPQAEVPAGSGGDFRFHGGWLDRSTGLYHLRARTYDPQTARFLSRDPWPADPRMPEELNRYSFARNNPLLFADPSGRFSVISFNASIGIQGDLRATITQVAKQRVKEYVKDKIGEALTTALGNMLRSAIPEIAQLITGLGGKDAGNMVESQLSDAVYNLFKAVDWLWLQPEVQEDGDPVTDGINPARFIAQGYKSIASIPEKLYKTFTPGNRRPDFILGKHAPTARVRHGNWTVGDIKLSAKTLANDYAGDRAYKPEQFRAITSYSKKYTEFPAPLFILFKGGPNRDEDLRRFGATAIWKHQVLPIVVILLEDMK